MAPCKTSLSLNKTKMILSVAFFLAIVPSASSFYFYPRARVFDPMAGVLMPRAEMGGLMPARRSLSNELAALRDPFSPMLRDPFFTNFARGFDELAQELDASLSELSRVFADAEAKMPQMSIERPEGTESTRLAVTGVAADNLNVAVDHALLTFTMTSADGHRRMSRTVKLPRNVVDADKISAFVEGEKLIVDVPDEALEPERKHVRARIDVQRLDAKLDAPATSEEPSSESSAPATSSSATTADALEEEMTVHDVPDDL